MSQRSQLSDVYITGLGAFFPGEPVGNDEMEDVLGRIGGRPSKVRERVLRRNGIRQRHYAMDRSQRSLYRNSEMAALAVRDALGRAGRRIEDAEFLAAATTQGDLLVPGFASQVHAELGGRACEIASLHGVCSSSVAALQSAYLQVRAGEKGCAVACASEFPSRLFKAARYERQGVGPGRPLSFDTEFLRWMLSDGAGAAVLAPRPSDEGVSLRIDWIELQSHAHRFPLCMYAGGCLDERGELVSSWLDHPSFEDAAAAGAMNLKQDVRLLDGVVELGVESVAALVKEGKIDPGEVDWVACHYSSDFFRGAILERLAARGIEWPEERWFSNLATRGNVGSASLFVLLEELVHQKHVRPGQTVLAVVPESGRSAIGMLKLTAVGAEAPRVEPRPATPQGGGTQAWLNSELDSVWRDFEARLRRVPLLERLESGRLRLEDYRSLLFHLRQQVVDGARWITRAASSLEGEALELRSLIIRHALEEHRDYELLERDYVAVGGTLEAIRSGEKNPGSEALSAWMLHEAGRPNPLSLLGAMWIIEGLGSRMARRWGEAIRDQLALSDDQVSFLLYHGRNDGGHLQKLAGVLGSELVTEAVARRIAKVARVTARLYALQLEEIETC